MKWILLVSVVLMAGIGSGGEAPARWAGVDETVIEQYAQAAGRPARDPLINTDQGDLLLFVFLMAGVVGGFVAGYAYRSLVGTNDQH